MFILILIFPILSMASGNAKSCSFEDLTENCEKLSSKSPQKITLPDGTFIPNIAALANSLESDDDSKRRGQSILEKDRDVQAQQQMDVVSALDKVHQSKMSLRLKYDLIGSPSFMASILNDTAESTVDIRWPPNDVRAPVRKVETAKVKKYLESVLSKNQINIIKKIEPIDTTSSFKDAIRETFKTRHPLTDEMEKITPARAKKLKDLVAFVRENLVKNLVGDRPSDQWSENERSAIEKIRNIKFREGTDPEVLNDTTCMGLMPNAFYKQLDNSIQVCPSFYNYPDATLISVLAHEMAHAIDPCSAQFGSYKMQISKLGEFDSEIEKDSDLKSIRSLLQKASANGSSVTSFPFEMCFKDESKLDFFIKKGILTQIAEPQRITETEKGVQGYILSDVYNCLISEKGGGFRRVTDADIKSAVDLVISKRTAVAGNGYDSQKDREQMTQAYKKYPQCISPKASTQMREALSDWMGSRVLGDFLEGKKLETPEERLAPIAYFAASVCLDRANISHTSEDQSVNDIVSDASRLLARDEDSHPGSKIRIENVLLSDPRIKKSLGCSEADGKMCAHNPTALINQSQQVVRKSNTVAPIYCKECTTESRKKDEGVK